MRRSAVALFASAGIVVIVDLTHKALAESQRGAALAYHPRSLGWIGGIALGAAAWAFAVCLTRSVLLAIPAGLLVGGAAANASSVLLWPTRDGVPNPLLRGGAFAYNLADVLSLLGLALLLPAAFALAVRRRDRLREPVRLRS